MTAKPRARDGCPLDAALELLGRAWMLEIIRELLGGPRHFVELRLATRCPSPSTFTRRLRMLETEGMVARQVLSRTPPSVSYGLTAKGFGLASALQELALWAERWLVARSDDPGADELVDLGTLEPA